MKKQIRIIDHTLQPARLRCTWSLDADGTVQCDSAISFANLTRTGILAPSLSGEGAFERIYPDSGARFFHALKYRYSSLVAAQLVEDVGGC